MFIIAMEYVGGGSSRGVPRKIVEALRRALATEPGDRWPELATLIAEINA